MTRALSAPGPRSPVYGLDLVRFLAAALVVAYHLGFKAWAVPGGTLNAMLGTVIAAPPGWRLAWCGWIGVQVFFVVSGAVIAWSAQGVGAGTFVRRRIARLLPALLIAVLIALPVAIGGFAMPPGQAAWLALRTVTFVPWGPWLIGQFWTIPIELGFYALVALLLAAGRGAQGLAWALGLASTGYWLAVGAGAIVPGGRLAELLLLQHGVYFAIGMLCARGTIAPRHFALGLACAAVAAVQIRQAAAWEMAARADLAAHWPLAYALWLGLTALVALSFFHREAIAARVGGAAPALRLAGLAGLATYPLYLVHIHVGGAILLAAAPLGSGVALAAALAGTLVVAIAIAAWLEPPLHALVRAGLDHAALRSRAASAQASASARSVARYTSGETPVKASRTPPILP
jgi:peptidoglycan/LPS O-acetylase OafA/YrhL